MSASLVGSEMCIRDRLLPDLARCSHVDAMAEPLLSFPASRPTLRSESGPAGRPRQRQASSTCARSVR
eukprot:6766258-Alexandrium_andersonii.AAC.1